MLEQTLSTVRIFTYTSSRGNFVASTASKTPLVQRTGTRPCRCFFMDCIDNSRFSLVLDVIFIIHAAKGRISRSPLEQTLENTSRKPMDIVVPTPVEPLEAHVIRGRVYLPESERTMELRERAFGT